MNSHELSTNSGKLGTQRPRYQMQEGWGQLGVVQVGEWCDPLALDTGEDVVDHLCRF